MCGDWWEGWWESIKGRDWWSGGVWCGLVWGACKRRQRFWHVWARALSWWAQGECACNRWGFHVLGLTLYGGVVWRWWPADLDWVGWVWLFTHNFPFFSAVQECIFITAIKDHVIERRALVCFVSFHPLIWTWNQVWLFQVADLGLKSQVGEVYFKTTSEFY